MTASFSKETGGSTNSVYKISNCLAQVHFKCVLIEAFMGARRKKSILNLDILVI